MATRSVNRLIHHLCQVLETDARTDGQLLEAFVTGKDQDAFHVLVQRYGPMVFGVCRRLLRNPHDVEDAFQTSFLVLIRKAASIRRIDSLGHWLHGVAQRTALKARTMTAKRERREKQVDALPDCPAPADPWQEVEPWFDQELSNLPEKYRLPIILCDLQGMTIQEATRQVGCPQGTLAGRLARGRSMLAKRLTRRGVVYSGGSLAVLLSQNVASASVPTSLMISTVKAASVLAAGSAVGVISPKVAALTEGVIKSMMLTKLSKAAVAGLVVLCLCGLGIGGFQASSAQETKTTITTTTITTRTKDKTSISGRWTGYGVNSLGWQSPGEMVITEAPDGTLTGTWGAPMRLPIENGKRVTEDTFRWEGWEDNFSYDVRCKVTGNCLVIDWTYDKPTDGKTPRHSGKIVLTRQTAPKPVKDAAEEQEATTTTITTTTKQSKTDPRLEGTWKLIEHDNSGVKTGDWNFVMTFANGWVVMAGDEACGPGEGAFTTVIHPKGNRNDLDVTWTKGSNKGKTTYYSYQIEGDKLHVVGGPQHDRIRWMTISSPAGSGVSHHVLQRAKATKTAEEQEQAEESPFFNGKNLFGWQGLPGYWKVRDGAIIGAPANGMKAHTFLCSEKAYRDFELKFKVKRKGGIGNSGVQIRSKIENRERFTATGPQIEIDSANYRYPPGSIVTEPVAHPHVKANAVAVADVWQDDGFNDMTIHCEGKWVTVTINGVEVLDTHFPSMPEEGIIAWQLHGGSGSVEAPKEVIFKDIHFKELNVASTGKTTPTYRLFRFHDGTSSGYYLNRGNGVWLESTGCDFRLEETTDEYMQIIRLDGGIRVRLPLRGGEALCKIGDENWRHLFWGSWRTGQVRFRDIEIKELPE